MVEGPWRELRGDPILPSQEIQRQLWSIPHIVRNPQDDANCNLTETDPAELDRYRELSCSPEHPARLTNENFQVVCENRLEATITHYNDSYEHASKQCVGNPCVPATGAKIETIIDYVAPGIEFSRTFRSNMSPVLLDRPELRLLPPYWTHSYLRLIQFHHETYEPVALGRPDGSVVPLISIPSRADVKFAADGSGTQLRSDPTSGDFEVFFSDGSIETYRSCGSSPTDYRLEAIDTRDGLTTTIQYAGSCTRNPTRIVGPFGHSLDILFTPPAPFSVNFIDKLIDAEGNEIDFAYSAGDSGTLDSVRYRDGSIEAYHYETTLGSQGAFLTGITDENGDRFSTFAYDDFGRVILSEHAGGTKSTSLTYDPQSSNESVVVTDAAGNTDEYFMEGANWGPTRVRYVAKSAGFGRFVFEGSNQFRLRRFDDANNLRTEYEFDDFHAVREVKKSGYTVLKYRDYEFLNETADLPIRIRRQSVCEDGVGREAEQEIQYVPGTQWISHVMDRGFRLETTGTCSPIERVTRFLNHNSFGQPRRIEGPRLDTVDVTDVEYYECSTGGACGRLLSVTDALGHTTSYDAYDSHGRLLQMTDPNGLVTTFTYDPRGNVTAIAAAAPDGVTRTTTFVYDGAGQVTSVTQPSGITINFQYHAAHQLIRATDAAGNSIEYGYDSRGNVTSEKVYDSVGVLARDVIRVFDVLNHLDSVSVAGAVTDYTADYVGDMTRVVTPAGGVTTNTFDRLRRLTRSKAPDFGQTEISYDVDDNAVEVRPPGGFATFYTYDDFGNRLSESSPDRGDLRYEYDEAGNQTAVTDGRGIRRELEYDALGRLTAIRYADAVLNTTFNYDEGTNQNGRLTGMLDESGSTIWTYDAFGDVTSRTQTVDGISLTVSYEYFDNGNLGRMVYPSGRELTFTHANGLLHSITVDAQPLLSNIGYEPFGPVNGWIWGNGTQHARTYNLRGELTQYTVPGGSRSLTYTPDSYIESQVGPLFDFSYGYDPVGRLLNFSSALPPPPGTAIPDSQAFTYDRRDNRLSLTENGSSVSYSVQLGTNRLLSITGPVPRSYTYDAAGNTLSDGVNTYAYDDRGRLVSVNGAVANYRYNGLGERVAKTTASGTTLFLYAAPGQLLGEYTATGAPIQETVWLGELPVVTMRSGGVYYVHPDQLGTPRLVTNGSTVVWRWASDPFGKISPTEDPDGDGTSFTYNFRFPGQYYDDESGLHYNYFRTYDPSTGRYLESDPIGLSGGLNTYGYVGGNPLSFIDPFGLIDLKIPGTTGQTTVHANPGPDVTDFRPEHEPLHVHLGNNEGPRVRTDNFEPLTDRDARRMTKEQKKFCSTLSDNQKNLIRARQLNVFRHGRAILALLATPAIALDSLLAACQQDPFFCLENTPFVLDDFEPESCDSGCE